MSERFTSGFLGHLDPDDVEVLVASGRVRYYPARSVVFFDGDDAHDVFIVLAGLVKVAVTSSDGREVVLDVLGAGHLLGELSAIDGGERSATATALNRAELVVIPFARFNSLVAERPGMALALLRSVAGRLRASSRHQLEFGTVDALGRVCGRLVALMERYGDDRDGCVAIHAPLSQQEIGGWAGLSRESVVKAFHALRALGWITTSGRSIRIVDEATIRARAEVASG